MSSSANEAGPAGATWHRPDDLNAAGFDVTFTGHSSSRLTQELAAQAYGSDYPVEVEPFGLTTWWTLGQLVAHARLNPGSDLVDLACGRGGVGLWLARATGANLVGVDWSEAGIADSNRRAPLFLPGGRARFLVGDLAYTGLPDQCADVVICLDAVFFAPDRIAALAEAHRLLRPGGRYIFTAPEAEQSAVSRHVVPDWAPLLQAVRLTIEAREIVPHFAEQMHRLYATWLSNLDRIRQELGPQIADDMEHEASNVGPNVQPDEAVLIVARSVDR